MQPKTQKGGKAAKPGAKTGKGQRPNPFKPGQTGSASSTESGQFAKKGGKK